jgi:putative tricarboxylic transport membrane protein
MEMLTRQAHLVAAVFSILFGSFIIFFSIPIYKTSIGGGGTPGAGVFPFWIGLITTFLGGIYLWQSKKNMNQEKFLPIERRQKVNLFQTAIAIVAYVSLIPLLGFLLTSFLLLVGYLCWIGGYKLHFSLPFSVGVTVLLYYCFRVLLYISLPRGFIGW